MQACSLYQGCQAFTLISSGQDCNLGVIEVKHLSDDEPFLSEDLKVYGTGDHIELLLQIGYQRMAISKKIMYSNHLAIHW